MGLGRHAQAVGLLALAALLGAGCIDRGAPPLEDQMRELGLPLESMMTVDDETKLTVRLLDGRPELLIFIPHGFGGWVFSVWPADGPTINGGAVGDGASGRYIVGAGQGPISEVRTTLPEARTKVVNPAIGGWVIVVPEGTPIKRMAWDLIGPDGGVLFSGVGLGPRDGPTVTFRP